MDLVSLLLELEDLLLVSLPPIAVKRLLKAKPSHNLKPDWSLRTAGVPS